MPCKTTLAATLLLCAGSAYAAGFAPCTDAASDPRLAGSVCAIEDVPGDPGGTAGGAAGVAPAQVSIFVRKFPVQGQSRGQVWLIAGGPGESGAAFYGLVPKLRQAFPGFDLVMPDHRGTGFSTRMCPDEESPASPGGAALAGAEWGSCFAHINAQPAAAHRFSQTNAAHDLKLLLARHRGQGKTWVYGASYGTQLVLRTMALGTTGVDGLVLDSLVPLQDDDKADLSRSSLVADRVGREWLADCDASPRCRQRMGEPVEALYRRVLARAAQEPDLLAAVPGKDPKRLFGSLLDVPGAARRIPDLIKELDAGKDVRMKEVLAAAESEMAVFGGLPQSPPSMPLVILISDAENNLQPDRTADEVHREEAGLLFSSSLPGHLASSPFPLYARDAWFARLPTRLPPTLVIHGSRDGRTPLDAAERHIAALRKAGPVTLYTARDVGHFVLWADRSCATAEVRQFVLGAQESRRCMAIATRD